MGAEKAGVLSSSARLSGNEGILRLDVVDFITNYVKQGILAITVEEDDREDAANNKKSMFGGRRQWFEVVPPRSVQIEKRKLSGIILASSHYKVTSILAL